MRIALTGGIGSGKSYVCHFLHERGVDVFNCDITAKAIIATDPKVRDMLTQLIADEAQTAKTPVLTKQSLGDYIRRGPDFAGRVNAIVHPRVAEAFELHCQSASPPARRETTSPTEENGKRTFWMECAILFESGFDRLVDQVIVVTCPMEERIRRIMTRDNCDEATARRWIALQMSDEECLARADYRIINDGITPIEPQLDAILETLGQKPIL